MSEVNGLSRKWVTGCEGLYSIDTKGLMLRHFRANREPVVVKQHLGLRGYIQVGLPDKVTKTLHRIVAEAFIPNPENLATVDHIDGNIVNNAAENLRWASLKSNLEYSKINRNEDYCLRMASEKLAKSEDLNTEAKAILLDLNDKAKQLDKLQKLLLKEKENFEIYIKKEKEKYEIKNRGYIGYKDTSEMEFESVEDMVKTVGKVVYVNGEQYLSARAAAIFIANLENKNWKHISKNIRRVLSGKIKSYKMYGKYLIN